MTSINTTEDLSLQQSRLLQMTSPHTDLYRQDSQCNCGYEIFYSQHFALAYREGY
jgi:hypothetical protein